MCSDSSDDTCGGCELLYQNDVTNATLKPCGVRTLDVKSAVISCGDSFNIVRTSFYSLNRSRPWKQVEGGF